LFCHGTTRKQYPPEALILWFLYGAPSGSLPEVRMAARCVSNGHYKKNSFELLRAIKKNQKAGPKKIGSGWQRSMKKTFIKSLGGQVAGSNWSE